VTSSFRIAAACFAASMLLGRRYANEWGYDMEVLRRPRSLFDEGPHPPNVTFDDGDSITADAAVVALSLVRQELR
jgi:hypothetical protein